MNGAAAISLISASAIGFTFLFAAIGKTGAFRTFADNLVQALSLPARFRYLVAAFIVILEWALAVGLLAMTQFKEILLTVSFMALFAFSVFIATVLVRQQVVKCNCFGASSQALNMYDLFRNALLILFALTALLMPGDSIDSPSMNSESLLMYLFGFAVFLIVIHLQEIVLIHKPIENPGQ